MIQGRTVMVDAAGTAVRLLGPARIEVAGRPVTLRWAGAPDVAVDIHALDAAMTRLSDTSVPPEQRIVAGRHVVSAAGLELATGVEHLGDDELAHCPELERIVLRGGSPTSAATTGSTS